MLTTASHIQHISGLEKGIKQLMMNERDVNTVWIKPNAICEVETFDMNVYWLFELQGT